MGIVYFTELSKFDDLDGTWYNISSHSYLLDDWINEHPECLWRRIYDTTYWYLPMLCIREDLYIWVKMRWQ